MSERGIKVAAAFCLSVLKEVIASVSCGTLRGVALGGRPSMQCEHIRLRFYC